MALLQKKKKKKMKTINMFLYRYFDFHQDGIVYIKMEIHSIIRETECFWVIKFKNKEKKIGKKSIRKWAWPSAKEAYDSYEIRKLRQLEFSIRNLNKSKRILDYIGTKQTRIDHFEELGSDGFTIKIISECIDIIYQ